MTAQAHFAGECPYCGLRLLRSPQSVAEPIIFCPTVSCRAGNYLKEVQEGRKPLVRGFVTEAQTNDMLREIGIPPEQFRSTK